MRKTFSRRYAAPRLAFSARPTPLSSDVIDAVLRYCDMVEDLGGGRQLKRLSQTRLADREVRQALGSDTARAGNVSILWNEREGEIIRVLEGPAAMAA